MRTDEELRAAGWPDDQIREYRRGAEFVGKSFASASLPASEPVQLPAFTAVQAPRVPARGDRGTWARTTLAGQLKAVVSPDAPDDEAREMQAARAFIDEWEFTYGRRPSMAEARLAVGRCGESLQLSGTATEIGRVFAAAGLPFATVTAVQALPGPGDVVHQPVRR
jgi:hypothetical protein